MTYMIRNFRWGDGSDDAVWCVAALKWRDTKQDWVFEEYVYFSPDKNDCEEELQRLTIKAQEG